MDNLWGSAKYKKVLLETDFIKGDKKNTDFRRNQMAMFDRDSFITLGNGDGELNQLIDQYDIKKANIPELYDLLIKMQFLIYYCDPYYCNQVYIIEPRFQCYLGLLSKLFEQFQFHVYVEDKGIGSKNLIYYTEKFEGIADEKIILIIDSVNDSVVPELITPRLIEQQTILEKSKFMKALINFLPEKSIKQYIDGIILRGIYSNRQSYIRPLVVTGLAYREWNEINYINKINFHESEVRLYASFLNPLNNDKRSLNNKLHLSNDYDSTAFIVTVIDYLKKINQFVYKKNVLVVIKLILDNCCPDKKINLKIKELLS